MARKDKHQAGEVENTEGEVAAAEEPTKKAPFCAVSTDAEGVTHFTFGNGNDISINPTELSEEQQRNLMYHGLVQKGRDSYASAKGDFAFGEAAVAKVIQNLREDRWTASRETGETKPKTGELAQALANLKGVDLEVAQAAVERASDEKRKTWRNNANVAAEIARIRAENARKRAEAAKTTDEVTLD